MAATEDDPIKSRMPRKEQVGVGDYALTLRTPTLVGHGALADAIKAFGVGRVVTAAGPVIAAARTGETEALMAALPHAASELLDAAGRESAAQLATLCGVLLDNSANFRALAQPADGTPGPLHAAPPPDVDSGVHIESLALQRFVAASVTVPQAVYILQRAVAIVEYTAMGKALISAAFGTIMGLAKSVTGPTPASVNGAGPQPSMPSAPSSTPGVEE